MGPANETAIREVTMSLVKKPTMTPRKLAAVRRNARLTNVLVKVGKGALTQKDVKKGRAIWMSY